MALRFTDRVEVSAPEPKIAEARNVNRIEVRAGDLSAFCKRVLPLFEESLEDALKSDQIAIFSHYSSQREQENTAPKKIKSFSLSIQGQEGTIYSASTLSWNSVGTRFAVGYCVSQHEEGWCAHRGFCGTFSPFSSSNKQINLLECDSCVTFVSFCPNLKNYILVGTFSGQINIYDLSLIGTLVCSSDAAEEKSHHEQITSIHWIKMKDNPTSLSEYLFLTTSLDGCMILWSFSHRDNALTVLNTVTLKSDSKHSQSLTETLGITSLEVLQSQLSETRKELPFLVGTEGGKLFQGRFPLDTETTQSTNVLKLQYGPHNGPISAVFCSPFHRNVFVSTSADTQVHICSLLRKKPVSAFVPTNGPLFGFCWSPKVKTIFAVASVYGCKIVDLRDHVFVDSVGLKGEHNQQIFIELEKKSHALSLQFHPDGDHLIIGDHLGYVHLYRLSIPVNDDDEILKQIGDVKK